MPKPRKPKPKHIRTPAEEGEGMAQFNKVLLEVFSTPKEKPKQG